MVDIYLYADETGNLDYDVTIGKEGASRYFGFETAELPRGFHAKNDSPATRSQMFDVVKAQAPRFDMTFLCKANAYPSVQARGETYLYQMAWYLHFKEVARQVAGPRDRLFAIVSSFGTKARATAARKAVAEVCAQVHRQIVLCVWDGPTSWGLQVADYGLWAAQRVLEGKRCSWYEPCVKATQRSYFTPWGRSQ